MINRFCPRCLVALPALAAVLANPFNGASAAEFYADPATGADTNDGSSGAPWLSLESIIADGKIGTALKAGDTLWLLSGYHGDAVLRSGTYDPPITIRAAASAVVTLRRVAFQQTHGWVLAGARVSPSYAATYVKVSMVSVDANSSNIEVRDCSVESVADASSWTALEWINTASNGIDVSGDRVTIRRSVVRNVRFGITVTGDHALIDSNLVLNFSADGLRGLGNYGVFQYNDVRNIYVSANDGDANHDDGFQSWSVGTGGVGTGEVIGVVLRGNQFLSTDDPNRPFQATMQGIGCFDGYFKDWVVENNVVITDHWHGISLYGMRGGRIVNNTVIDVNTVSPGPPWIMVTAHKDGTPSENVLVRNNLATDFNVSGTNITNDHNLEISMGVLAQYFVDPAALDLHLVPTAAAVDSGAAELAPALDRDGIPRPQGTAVDVGAYEWHDPSVVLADSGPLLPDGGPTPDDDDADHDEPSDGYMSGDVDVLGDGVTASEKDRDGARAAALVGGCACASDDAGGPALLAWLLSWALCLPVRRRLHSVGSGLTQHTRG